MDSQSRVLRKTSQWVGWLPGALLVLVKGAGSREMPGTPAASSTMHLSHDGSVSEGELWLLTVWANLKISHRCRPWPQTLRIHRIELPGSWREEGYVNILRDRVGDMVGDSYPAAFLSLFGSFLFQSVCIRIPHHKNITIMALVSMVYLTQRGIKVSAYSVSYTVVYHV